MALKEALARRRVLRLRARIRHRCADNHGIPPLFPRKPRPVSL
jgi:hypothetical protein